MSLILIISFHENDIESNGASILFNTLIDCIASITIINLSRNKLDDDCMKSLGELIKNNQTIENINICYNKITDKGIDILSSYLIGNTTLKSLGISNNKGITDKSALLLKKLIEETNIENIDIRKTSIEKNNVLAIALTKNIFKNVPCVNLRMAGRFVYF